jgi:hypothetical protein
MKSNGKALPPPYKEKGAKDPPSLAKFWMKQFGTVIHQLMSHRDDKSKNDTKDVTKGLYFDQL